MPSQLRQLFPFICIFQSPCNALQLWELFKDSLSEDHLQSDTTDIAHQLALLDISDTLKLHGTSLTAFDLPILKDSITDYRIIPNVQSIQQIAHTNMIERANEEQRIMIDRKYALINVYRSLSSIDVLLIDWWKKYYLGW